MNAPVSGAAEQVFARFLDLERQTRAAHGISQLAYSLVNDGQSLFGFRHAALLIAGKVQAVTGVVKVARNPLGSAVMRDLIGEGVIDKGMIPKVEGAEDIHYVDRLLAQLEAKAGLTRPILVHAILETALAELGHDRRDGRVGAQREVLRVTLRSIGDAVITAAQVLG